MPLEHEDRDFTHRLRPARIIEDRPLAALDVHLHVVIATKERENIDSRYLGADIAHERVREATAERGPATSTNLC